MNIGLYFGSFNPIHYGHAIISKFCLSHFNLDKILLIVSPQNPFKDAKTLIDFKHRYNMVNELFSDTENILASDIESKLPQPSYTWNTINHLKNISNDKYTLILGSDNFINIDRWKNSNEIKKLPMIIIPRYTSDNESYNNIITKITNMKNNIFNENKNNEIIIANDAPIISISSTIVRNELIEEKDVTCFIDKKTYNYIKKNNLYKLIA